jgi:iron complex outermembrane recepter protein
MLRNSNLTPAMRRRAWTIFLAGALTAALAWPAPPAHAQQKTAELADRSLEDLMNLEVTSVSKKAEKLSRTASAVFVITQEDIRRSGALNIPDLLRMVPGVDVAQVDSNTWAISVRGFNSVFGNELLVLVDGRSVYTTSFGGVFWDTLDLPLEDIERIEVIRGPGGSAWGANAVNGVINIITKKATDTHGGLVVGGGGNVQQGFGTAQYGGKLGSSTDYRVFAKYFNDDHFPDPLGQNGADGWHGLRGGFRVDTTLTPRDTLMFQGDMYTYRAGDPVLLLPSVTSPSTVPVNLLVDLTGGFLQGSWDHAFSSQSSTTLQLSYTQYERDDNLGDHRGTLDLSFQHHYSGWSRQNIVWGVGYRRDASTATGSLTTSFVPANLTTHLFSTFVQDEITLLPDRLFLTGGVRLEHNYYTGVNVIPSVRVAWTPGDRQTVWIGISDAVRSPSQLDAGFRANFGSFTPPGGPLTLLSFIGNPNVDDESLIAYEFGYRTSISDRLSIDFASYYNDYNHQETTEPAPPFFENTPAPPHLVLPSTYKNLMYGETHGFEVSANWKPIGRWTLSPGYAFEQIHMHLYPASQDTTSVASSQGASPVHGAQLRSHLTLWRGVSWDASAYFTGRLTDPVVPSYTRVDTQLAWQIGEGVTLSFVGQNLAQDHHFEFVDDTGSARTTEIKRSAYAKFSWRF